MGFCIASSISMAFLKTFGIAALAAFYVTASPAPKSDIKCPITKDARISHNFALSTFDTTASSFNPDYVLGQNLTWSKVLNFPPVLPSKFDICGKYKAVEVTISDRSIFAPGGNPQVGFRRAGLLLGNGSDATNVGVKTFHWSVKQDLRAKMNLTHEYMNAWHEKNDYSGNQFSFNTGIMLEQDKPTDSDVVTTGLDKRLWKFLDHQNNVIWTTWIDWNDWQNFAIKVDYVKNTLQVFYSKGYDSLKAVTKPLPNDNSGGGQFQIGVLKKPTETVSVVNDGYQEAHIHEGQIYGGIFIEDSASGCVSK